MLSLAAMGCCVMTTKDIPASLHVQELSKAADNVRNEHEAKAVLHALSHTPGLTECAIAPDVLAKLLPDEGVVVLPRLGRVGGGPLYRFAKRAFDVASCSAALVVLAVPMAVIALMIKRQDPGPAIYAQTRVGKGGRLFKVYKFRSMYVDAEARGAQWAQGDDPRVTPLGRRLRNSRLDEIPQFWNVVRGDIPLRILKTRRGFSVKMLGTFALPARLARTRIAASLQVRAMFSVIVGMPQIIFDIFIARYGEMREVFAKRVSRIDFSHCDLRRSAPCSGPSV